MTKFLWLVLTCGLLSACTLPTARLTPKVEEFKANNPSHFQAYSSHGRQMRFVWTGDPKLPPLIFVHGSPGDWSGWVEFLNDSNLQKHFHVLAVDRPGFGGSEAGHTEPSLSIQAAEVMDVLQFNTSGRPAILVGHSYGGAVVAQIAADMPEKIAAVLFVASSVDPSLESTKWFQYPASWWPMRALLPNALRVCNEEIRALKSQLETLRDRWSLIHAQVGTIQGLSDDLVPPGNQDFILRHIPNAQIRVKQTVEGMNHFVPWEHPDYIYTAIARLAE